MKRLIARALGYKKPKRYKLNTPFKVFLKKGRFILRDNLWVEYWDGSNWHDHSIMLIGLKKSDWLVKYER